MDAIGIVAIGKNEGERLRRCLTSVLTSSVGSEPGDARCVVYVDSNSTDDSVAMAKSMGAHCVVLDLSIPFSAARARNEGFAKLMQVNPNIKYVYFTDGDCELVDGFLTKAIAAMEARPELAVVCGRLRERFPEASIYNRLADVEWNTPVGDAHSCGGIAMIRTDAFKQVDGYNPSIVAGEEPEMCQRMRAKGWKITRIDAEMALHDLAMMHFGQWWKRNVRSGYGMMDVATRFGEEGLFVKKTQSARMWAYGYPLVVLITIALSLTLLPKAWALTAIALAILVLPAQMLRVAWRKRAFGPRIAVGYGILTMISHWANVAGQKHYLRDRKEGKLARQISYKTPVQAQ